MAKIGKIEKFEDLIVWQKAKNLSRSIYEITATGPFSKDYSFKNQIRKASVSIMSNIAEGFERYSPKEFRHFLSISRGSAAEVRSQLHLAFELGYINTEQFEELGVMCRELSLVIGSLRRSINVYNN